MVYQFKPKVYFPVKANVAGKCLEKIRQRNSGKLLAEDVVEDAKPVEAVLHPCFEWDDVSAAMKYRLDQAQALIRAIVIVPETDDGNHNPVRAFVHIKNDSEDENPNAGYYTAIADAMSDPVHREQVVRRAMEELDDWRKRYNDFEEFASVFGAIDDVRTSSTSG
ncbi:MAG: hypothetical protein HQL87_07765 [Magnetococcales bacterium]|nr:hypothetical protein [Magnetococcales bacterium]